MITTESQTADSEERDIESQLSTADVQQRDIQHRSFPAMDGGDTPPQNNLSRRSLQNPEPSDGGGSWNRMRIHQQRKKATTISPLATKETMKTDPEIITTSPPATPLKKQQDCTAEVTSIEKQQKLHRRSSDDSLNTMLMSQLLHRQRQEQQSQNSNSSRNDNQALKARRRLRAPFSRPPSAASTLPSSSSSHLLTLHQKQREHGKDVKQPVKFDIDKAQAPEEPSRTQRPRRKYQRRNSFLVKRGNPFLSVGQNQQLGGDDRMMRSSTSLDDDELIRSLIEKVDFGAKPAASSIPTNQYSQDANFGTSPHKMEDSKKGETTDENVKNSGEQDCWVHDTLYDISKTHGHVSDGAQWGNLSWSDSDDTRWYRMISSLSVKPGEDKSGKDVSGIATSSHTISTTAAAKCISEGPDLAQGGLGSSNGGHRADEESNLYASRRIVTQLRNPYNIPHEETSGFLLTSPTPASNQFNKDSLVIPSSDPLLEASPRTPRLMGYVPSRKTIAGDKKTSPPTSTM